MTTPIAFESVFGPKPILAMLHLKGQDPEDTLARAVREVGILQQAGVDAVIVENYFGLIDDMQRVLEHLAALAEPITYGVNALGHDRRGFELARDHGAAFLQLDSVAGHLAPADDAEFAQWLDAERRRTDALVLGGVRFKYQPYLSGNPLAVDLELATHRCDAVVVTGAGTGLQTGLDKITEFRQLLPERFPLVVGAGVTAGNCADQMELADAAIVGSYLKDNYTDTGEVDAAHAQELVAAFGRLRAGRQLRMEGS